MAYAEVEHEDFVKALRLLHSRSPESSDELKKLLDSYYAKQFSISNEYKKSKDVKNAFAAIQSLNQAFGKETEKRHRASEDDSEATDIEDNENTDAGEFASDLGIACVVCKQIEITTYNQLIECQECRSLYHQECHKPPLSKKEINDPRSIWYCSKCNKNIVKKIGKPMLNKPMNKSINPSINSMQNTLNISPSSPSISMSYQNFQSKDIPLNKSQLNFVKSSEPENKSNQNLFKRVPGKFSFSSTSSSSKPGPVSSLNRSTGQVNLGSAAKNKMSSINGGPSSFSPGSLPNLDKRFQNLKKAKLGSKFNS